jgi:50S ribosomal subunit-associated GTPase HflX
VLDASHPNVTEHYKAVMQILGELEADDKMIITVLNKVDRIEDTPEAKATLENLRRMVDNPVEISALTGEGIMDLLAEIESETKSLDLDPLPEEAPAPSWEA